MAHFAKLDDSNNVLAIVTCDNDVATSEQAGIDYLTNVHGYSNWKQCSYNTKEGVHYEPNSDTPSADQSQALRANFPAPGWKYDSVNNIYHEVQPFASWTLNTTTGIWEAPTARPTIAQQIIDEVAETAHFPQWNESNQRWESDREGNFYWDGSSWIAF